MWLFIYETVFTIGEWRAISHSNDTGQQAQQVEILDFNGNSSGERRLKFIASGEDDDNKKPRAKHREHRLANKHVQRQRQNTTITLLMEPMKRENTDCRRCKKRWGDQATLTVYSKITFFDTTIGSNSYTDDLYNLLQEYLSNGLRTAYQHLSFILQLTVYNTDNV